MTRTDQSITGQKIITMKTIIYRYNVNGIWSFIPDDNLGKPKQTQKGRGRGASRGHEKGQVTSPSGRGTPLGG